MAFIKYDLKYKTSGHVLQRCAHHYTAPVLQCLTRLQAALEPCSLHSYQPAQLQIPYKTVERVMHSLPPTAAREEHWH